KGQIILVDEKTALMEKLGKKQLVLQLRVPLEALPPELEDLPLELSDQGRQLIYTFDSRAERTGIAALLKRLGDSGIDYQDLETRQSALEEIFVELVGRKA